jgi:hypothetical protein
VRDAAWGCDWVATPVPFQRCLVFIIAAANKGFTLTAGKFVPVCKTTMNVRLLIVQHNIQHIDKFYSKYLSDRKALEFSIIRETLFRDHYFDITEQTYQLNC